jgi:cation diffusion facilitator family transporter
LALVMGSSQAMKTIWIEDMLGLLPALSFLIAEPLRNRPPDKLFPYGYHRAISIAFLVSALALAVMGAYLFFESGWKLLKAEHPSIGTFTMFGVTIWQGWLMLPALAWSFGPMTYLGHAKVEPARKLHNKALYSDAEMNKADWLSGVASVAGILGIAIGWWWADSAAALVISFEILRDGYKNLKACIFDLMDRVPQTVDHQRLEALPARIETELGRLDWVKGTHLRMREAGQIFFGEVFIQPTDQRNLLSRIEEAKELIHKLDWRVQDIVVQLVTALPGDEVSEQNGKPGE